MQSKTTPIESSVCKGRSSQINLTLQKSLLAFWLLLFVFFEAKAQVPIVYYDFEDNGSRNSVPAVQGGYELALPGVNPSVITRVGGGSIGSAAGAGIALSSGAAGATAGIALSSANWPTSSTDPGIGATSYYEFSFSTPGLADLGIDMDIKSTNGPTRWGMLYSLDNGLTFNPIQSTGGAKNLSSTYERLQLKFDGAAAFGNHPKLIFRLYAYKGGTASTGTFEIDNLTFLAKTLTTSTTLLDEAHIYTCMTSGATGGLAVRDALKISGTGTVATMTSGLALSTSLEMAGGTLEVGTYNLILNCPTITGTTAEAGVITTPTSSLTIGGTATAFKLPSNILELANLTINRPNGASLDNKLVLNGTLTLTSGILTTTNAKKLTIGENGTVAGGSATSFINGPVSHVVVDILPVTKVFPVGRGAAYRPVTLSLTQDQAIKTTYTIEQKEGSHAPLAIPAEEDLKTVSGIRYFSIRKSGAANLTAGTVSLVYGADDWVNGDPTELRIAKTNSDSSAWMNLGRHTSSSTSSTGTITSSINFTSFSDFLIANSKNGNNSLPVELASFTATRKGQVAQLDWATASEKDNKGFEVQVSANGNDFRTLGFVASKNANSAATQSYSFTDKETGKTGTCYYRLKQTDFNGFATYSAIRALDFGKHHIQVSAYPNPFEQNITIDITGQAGQVATLEVTDALGSKVYFRELNLQSGQNQTTLQLPASLTNGIYTLTLKTSEGIKYHKIIKK